MVHNILMSKRDGPYYPRSVASYTAIDITVALGSFSKRKGDITVS